MVTDNGGQDFGGLDWSIVPFNLTVMRPRDELGQEVKAAPVLQGPRQLNVPETKEQVRVIGTLNKTATCVSGACLDRGML